MSARWGLLGKLRDNLRRMNAGPVPGEVRARPEVGFLLPMDVLRSGAVERWHCNPDVPAQSNAAHQWGVAILVMYLWPGQPHLARAAILHDCGELWVGDIPSPVKDANPQLAAAHQQLEHANLLRMGVKLPLSEVDDARLLLADRLEAYLWVRFNAPYWVVHSPSWLQSLGRIREMAADLRVPKEVESVLTPALRLTSAD